MCARAETTGAGLRFKNPIVYQRADPFVRLHADGFYYFTASVPAYDLVELRRAPTIEELSAAEPRDIWRKHAHGPMGAHIWAPELHYLDGRWYIYFAAGDAERIWDIRIYVLENESPNPLEGHWIERGRLDTGWDSFSLDATTFEHRGTRYLLWAQHDDAIENNTNLYIARMASPTALASKAVMLTQPQLPWETRGFKVNEGPAVLIRNGRVFVTYSASATDANYCMGLLTADENADLLNPAAWHKAAEPVLQTDVAAGIYGPGHNSFTTTADGKADLLVYHARDYQEIMGDPLEDANRHTRVSHVHWNADGTPRFVL